MVTLIDITVILFFFDIFLNFCNNFINTSMGVGILTKRGHLQKKYLTDNNCQSFTKSIQTITTTKRIFSIFSTTMKCFGQSQDYGYQ